MSMHNKVGREREHPPSVAYTRWVVYIWVSWKFNSRKL